MSTKLSDLTNATDIDDGTGVFDVLIASVERRIEKQLAKGRITGADYATVYLGALQAILQQSIAFLLEKDKTAMEAAILQATVEKQWGYGVTLDSDGNLVLGASTGTGLIDYEVTKTAQEVELLIGQTSKAYAEVALLGQKQETELAQTSDASGGITLAQQNLYKAQTLGFQGKHKNELIKHMLDSWSVIYSITDGALPNDIGTPDFLETTGVTQPGLSMPDLDILVSESDALFD